MTRARLVVAVSVEVGLLVCGTASPAASVPPVEAHVQPLRIVVPVVKGASVIPDGTFSPGEWDGAFQQRLSEDFEVYLLADSAHLYVGFRFLKDVAADFVGEVYIATGDETFLALHSSGALGEAVNRFADDLAQARFSLGNTTGWESNATAVGERCQGKEFKIGRGRLPDATTVRLAGGMIVVNRTIREKAAFPARHGFRDAGGWAELVVPAPNE